MTEERTAFLSYAVRGAVVLKYCGQLALLLGVLTLVPLAVALIANDQPMLGRYALLCGGLFLLGGVLARLEVPARIQDNEALTIATLAFVGASLLMSWPMMGDGLSFMDALFEAVSAVTTTGLSTLSQAGGQSTTLLFSRAWIQWYGGLGFIVLSVALLVGHQAAARRLVDPIESGEGFLSSARAHARRSLIVYLTLTLLGLLLVWSLTGDGLTSLLHVLSAVSTGGFSSFSNSLAGLDSRPAAVAVMLIAFLGAVSFPLYWRMVHAGRRGGVQLLLGDVELRALLMACLVTSLLLVTMAWLRGAELSWYHSFMLGFSAQTTTGFSTQSIDQMDPGSKLVMIFSMLLGGSVGSSAGGFKLLRWLILLRLLQLMIRRTTMPPHAVAEPYLGGRKLEPDDVMRALQLIVLFLIVVVLSWLPFIVMGYDPLDALFEVASATGTVGLSSGITRPELEPLLKAILCFDMLAGRLEILALLVILYPRNWFGRRREL